MIRSLLAVSLGLLLSLSATTARADEIKRALFVLGVHMEGAEGVAIEMTGEATKLKPGAIALMKRQLTNSIDVAEALKLPSAGLKALLADVDMDKVSFADMASRMGTMRLEMQAAAAKSINPGAAAFFIMGVHLSGGERVAIGAGAAPRADKPGTGALIERQLVRMADGAPGTGLTVKPVLDIQTKLGTGASFPDLASDLGKLRLAWQDELAKQPGFGAIAGDGKVLFSTSGTLATTDPKDKLRTSSYAKVHTVRLTGGQAVVIDLESGDGSTTPKAGFFDTWLRVEDSTGKELAYNDDVVPGKNYNSRVEFTPTQDGDYRIVVTSYAPGATGAYSVTIRQK